jgi:deoxyribodipyrimidine photo-lyase
MITCPSLVWFRQDLRIQDNPALHAALKRGGPIIPVFIWAPEEEGFWAPGAASQWWLHQSIASVDTELRRHGSRLVLRRGSSPSALAELVREAAAGAVFWNRRYEPAIVKRDTKIQETLRADGLTIESFNASLLCDPWDIQNKQGNPFQVFTPFWKALVARGDPPKPLSAPSRLAAPAKWPNTSSLSELKLESKADWAAGMREAWSPGTQGAATQMERFLAEAIPSYAQDRDRPDLSSTSRLSPHLHFGEISPRQVWYAVREKMRPGRKGGIAQGAEAYLRQVGWREFAHHLLFHFPHTTDHPLRSEFADFPWREDTDSLRAWQRGETGYPLVDAGMRELWASGWMHNRIRMIAASFLVKNLLLRWQEGAKWFWDTLVDADLADNTLGWQWVAGCGADAAPYFRIFNPMGQGEKFDPNGDYVRRWVPELRKLPASWIHKPWEASPSVLAAARVELGRTYPKPIVDHAFARQRALAALETVKKRREMVNE